VSESLVAENPRAKLNFSLLPKLYHFAKIVILFIFTEKLKVVVYEILTNRYSITQTLLSYKIDAMVVNG